MKRSAQVALLLGGLTAAGAGAYALTPPRRDCPPAPAVPAPQGTDRPTVPLPIPGVAPGRERVVRHARELGTREIDVRALHLLAAVSRAERRTEEGLQLCREAGSLTVVEQTVELKWRQAYELGRLQEQAGRLDAAAAALTRAVATLEQIRAELRDDRFRGGYLLDKQDAYAALVRVLIRLGRADAALGVSETLRAHWQLSNTSVGQTANAETPRAAELRRRIQKLQHEHDLEVSRPVHEQRRGALAVFSEEIASAQREYAAESAGRRSTTAARIQSAAAIRRSLPSGTTVVEFVIGRDDSAVFLLTRDRISAHVLAVGARDLQVRIELLRDLLARRPLSDAWLAPAGALAEILLPPSVRPGRATNRLILVPNGVLHYLPFAVLPLDGTGRELLIDRFEVAYVPTASSIVGAGSRSAGAQMLALAPARPGLRHTATEVRELSQLHQGTTMLIGDAATESAFKASAGRYDILHLATHGFFNRANPLFSGVILERTREDDGHLEVHEILRLPLRASLVTLSACRTGVGGGQVADVPPGDDFVGLTRAFLAAGSGAVLATLWDLDDEGAVSLMREFYGRLADQGPHRALREAQRAMLASGTRFTHPFYWAGLVLVTPSAGIR